MIQINVVSRINEDKNFFFDLLFAIYKLREKNINDFHLLFIGDLLSKTVYQDMVRLINLFDIADNISFTGKSIRLSELSEVVRDGYFFNFTIGNFMGFSGIESINLNHKTIFYNTDKNLVESTRRSPSMCPDVSSLISLLINLKNAPKEMEQRIIEDNLKTKNDFLLSDNDNSFLRSILFR